MSPMSRYHPQASTSQPSVVNILRHHCFPRTHVHQVVEGEGWDKKEAMFEKLLTPSDVGKLNRLIIPKQHAEKYFPNPLCCGSSSPGVKGLLLSFEDESSGKSWPFRYSYWSSSQSYAVTRGWRRFVKEKRLHAGDVVCFERMRSGGGCRLYISCRRREQRCGGDGDNATEAPTQSSKRLRLFGVNLDWVPELEIDAVGVGSSLSNRA